MLARHVARLVRTCCKQHINTSSQILKKRDRDSRNPDIGDKAVLVTGGASGIGYACCKEFLKCGARGVCIADRDSECGEAALRKLADKYGNDRVVFVQCDVTKSELVDWAFKTTLNAFQRIDIVVNNAGVLNDKVWENEIHTNVCGTMVGSLLGLQYMAAHCDGNGGFVVNIGSTMGLSPCVGAPIYSMTQAAILNLTRGLGVGCHVDRTQVKVLAVAAGLTKTPLMIDATKNAINTRFSADFQKEMQCHKWQKPKVVAKAVLKAIEDGEAGSVWIVENGKNPYKISIPCYRDLKGTGECTINDCKMPGKLAAPRTSDDCEDDKKSDKKGKPADPSTKKPCKMTSSKSRDVCGYCPEPKWFDGAPPPPKQKEVFVDDSCDACDVDLNYKPKKAKSKKKCTPKITYLGTCQKPTGLGKAVLGSKVPPAAKAPPKTKAPVQAPAKAAAKVKAPAPKAPAKPPPKGPTGIKPVKAAVKEAAKTAKAVKPVPKGNLSTKKPAPRPKPAVTTKTKDAEDEDVLSFKCECDEDGEEKKRCENK